MGKRRQNHPEPARRRHRHLRHVAVLPSLMTLINLIAGFAAIHFVSRHMDHPETLWLEKPSLTYFAAAGYLIFLAMVADLLDGRLARMSGTSSEFGGQLDSLADIVSFGVAPALLMLRVVEVTLGDVIGRVGPAFGGVAGKLIWLVGAAYVACAALRLARFNVENTPDESSHRSFTGLPSPAAAGVVASLVLLWADLLPEFREKLPEATLQIAGKTVVYVLPLATLGAALLMVSNVPYKHVFNQYVAERKPFGHLVKLVMAVLCLIWKPQLTLAVCFVTFAAWGAVVWFLKQRKKTSKESSGATSAKHSLDDGRNDENVNATDQNHKIINFKEL